MSGGGSHDDFDGEIQRAAGQRPPNERHHWWLGPALILVVLAVIAIVLGVLGVL